jgi:hypothetical protein
MKCNSIDKRVLYVLTNTEGEKFLGHTAALVNPCGDYWEKDSYKGGYVREGSKELITEDKIVSAERIEPIDCYYWDADANDYVLYVVEYPESESIDPERAMRNMHTLFRMVTDIEERNNSLKKGLRLHKISEIRSWLLINNKCKGPVYIDADLSVTCNGERIELDSNLL